LCDLLKPEEMVLSNSQPTVIIADSHVHIYDCFDVSILFNATLKNFQNCINHTTEKVDFTGFLFLVDRVGQNWFIRLRKIAENQKKIGDWSLMLTAEDNSLIAQKDHNIFLYILNGKQYSTTENLEILSLVSSEEITGEKSGAELVELILEKDGIPVVPWGFGKWIGKRKKVVENILQSQVGFKIFVGDNGGRPSFFAKDPLLELAKKNGIQILNGSDPLPLRNEIKRVGSFGFILEESVSPDYPAKEMKILLKKPHLKIKNYGQLMSNTNAFKLQAQYRLFKR
jgi:hypothetical protein